ncbi:MAG TPA: hypothetical protein VHW23_24150 [Kofleriaceae bacterium]|jgi:hypothetical protein|nr:hypothetical protein [Kofleriaceae bacterium]
MQNDPRAQSLNTIEIDQLPAISGGIVAHNPYRAPAYPRPCPSFHPAAPRPLPFQNPRFGFGFGFGYPGYGFGFPGFGFFRR